MLKNLVFKFFLLCLTISSILANGYLGGGYVGGFEGGHGGSFKEAGQIHMPYQISNIMDLFIPFHVRVSTDGLKHKPILRVPLLELAAHGHLNQPSIVHLIHGSGIPW